MKEHKAGIAIVVVLFLIIVAMTWYLFASPFPDEPAASNTVQATTSAATN